jgi:hypothetical protein
MKKIISLVLVLVLGLAAEVAKADFIWGTPTNLGPEVNSSYGDGAACISANGLELYFTSERPGGYGGLDLWVMKRPTTEDDWSDPVNLGSPANSQYSYWEPSISSDGLSLYFSDGHMMPDGSWPSFGNHLPGGLGGQGDIWMVTRETIHNAWGAPINIGPAVNSRNAIYPSISADGLSLYLQSHQPNCDIMVATRESTSDSFGNPVKPVFLKNVNSTTGEWMPNISVDGRMLFFSRNASTEIWVAMRATIYDDFGFPVKLPPQISMSPYLNTSPSISPDGSTLYFDSDRPGGVGSYDIWQVSISPVVDFNGDGIVDSDDTRIMIDYWHTDNSLCDIGPMPWGDGIVDAQDLGVLLEHLLLEDVSLIAHWKLDETEGIIAGNSINGKHGIVNGNPAWQLDGGMIGGALLFNGVEDYVDTPFVLNPAVSTFSVFAWVKGGVPGQAILSQDEGANWLAADPLAGQLSTSLLPPLGRFPIPPLVSGIVITDGNWHRVGLVWDGSDRILYVDNVEVARDVVGYLESASGGLYIGVGGNLEPDSCWSGLIDDVRIYDRAIVP